MMLEAELQPALRRYWHPVATAAEVTTEPTRVKLLGEGIVVYRDDQGLVALRDQCVHRGVALSTGRLVDGLIECPYHGWQYDRSGAVAHIPALGAGGTIPSQARIWCHHVREAHGAVWVAPEAPAADLPPWPDDDWNSPDWHVFLVDTWFWEASAGRMIENAIDFAHFNFVHQGFTELADGPFIKPFEVTPTDDGMVYAYDDTLLMRSYTLHMPFTLHDRKSVISASGGRTWSEQGDTKAGDVTTITFIASPTDRAETLIFVFLSRNHSFDTPDAEFAAGFNEVMEQDRLVVEAQDPPELPLDPRDELHLKLADAGSIAYRKLLRDLAPAS